MSREVLESLVEHPGWQLFYDHVKQEWGAAGCWRKSVEQGLPVELVKLTNLEIGALMEWPKSEAARLKRQEETKEPTLSRRGGL